jgi:hypothetical protein
VIDALLVRVLRDQEKIMTAEGVSGWAEAGSADVVVVEFRAFLAGERGLAAETVRCYGNHAGAFLNWLPQPVDATLAGLSAGQVTGYVIEYCGAAIPNRPRRWSPRCGRCCGFCT